MTASKMEAEAGPAWESQKENDYNRNKTLPQKPILRTGLRQVQA